MFCLDWLQAGRAIRGKPRLSARGVRSWPLLGLLASLAVLQSGCQSGPFSNCGSGLCGSGSGLLGPCGFFSRVQDRMFTRRNHAVAGDCCESGVITGTPVEVATPATVVTPGAITYPPPGASRGAVVVPGPSDPTDLTPVDPAAKSRVVPSQPGNGASRSGPQGANYQTRGQDSGARIARRRTDSFGTTTVSTPEPTGRSAQSRNQGDQGDQSGALSDPLDNIPPLDLPGEVSRSKATPPVPPAAPSAAAPAAARPGDVKTESPAPPARATWI